MMRAITETYLTVAGMPHIYFSIYLFSYFDVVLKSIYDQFTVARSFLGLIILTLKIND